MGNLLKLGLTMALVTGSLLATAQTTLPSGTGQFTYALVSSSITTTLEEGKHVGQNTGAGDNTAIGIELQCWFRVTGSTEGCPWSSYFLLADNSWSEVYSTYANVAVGRAIDLYGDHQIQTGTETWKRNDSNETTYSRSLNSSIFSDIFHVVAAQ